MNLREKLKSCFQTVFPDLSEADIKRASVTTVAAWDSVAGITLLHVVGEEFQIDIDLDRLAELDSFESLAGYLSATLAVETPDRGDATQGAR